MVRQELQFESNGKEKFTLLILTLITRHKNIEENVTSRAAISRLQRDESSG